MLLESGEMIVNSIRCGGHRACNVWTGIWDVRVATHLQACLELRSDSGIYGVSLKLFGPFPLAPGLMKHVLVSSSGGPGPACGPPLPMVAHVGRARGHCQDHSADPGAEWAGGGNGTCLGKQFHVNQSRNRLKCWSGWENAHSASV